MIYRKEQRSGFRSAEWRTQTERASRRGSLDEATPSTQWEVDLRPELCCTGAVPGYVQPRPYDTATESVRYITATFPWSYTVNLCSKGFRRWNIYSFWTRCIRFNLHCWSKIRGPNVFYEPQLYSEIEICFKIVGDKYIYFIYMHENSIWLLIEKNSESWWKYRRLEKNIEHMTSLSIKIFLLKCSKFGIFFSKLQPILQTLIHAQFLFSLWA